MRRHQHPTNNRVLGAPIGWDQKKLPCGALPITDIRINGSPAIISYWEVSPEELEILKNGGKIALYVLNETIPPIAMEVEP